MRKTYDTALWYDAYQVSSSKGKNYSSTNGKDANCAYSEDRSVQVSQRSPAEAINSFKSFVRDNFEKNIRKEDLLQLLQRLETDSRVEAFYDIVSYAEDLQYLENQYFKLRIKLNFRPFFESMLSRIVEKDKTSDQSGDFKKSLRYLYAAVLSKLTSNVASQRTVLNLNAYLDEIERRIKELKSIEKDVQVTNHQIQYNNSLYSKINAANELIQIKILPEIDASLDSTKTQIYRLINETLHHQNQTEEEIINANKKKRELGKAMMLSSVFSTLKIAASLLAFAGPVGAGVGAVLGAGAMIGDMVATDMASDLKTGMAQVTWSVNKIEEEIKYTSTLFKAQLDDAAHELDSHDKFKDDFKKIRSEIEDMREKLKQALAIENDVQAFISKDMKVKLDDLIDKEAALTKKLKPQDEKIMQDKLRILGHVKTVVQVIGVSAEAYNKYKNDKEKLETMKNAVQALEVELAGWNIYEQKIYNIMVPMFQLMRDSMKTTIKSLEGNSHVQLDIRKWEIRSKLRDVKFTFDKMTEKSNLQKDFKHYFEKVEAAMDVLIDVYDRIESLVENSHLATQISQLVVNGPPLVNDFKLENAIKRLDAIVQTNLILEQHELVVNAFKQHYFPFAPLYFGEFELPTQFQPNDTDSLKRLAIEQIKALKSGVVLSQVTIQNRDKYLYSNVSFDSNHDLKDAPPFFTWKSDEIFNNTQRLMRGAEIFLNADITKGSNDYAVKFNELIIRLKFANHTMQAEFDAAIKDYHVTFKMVGNSFYRCGQRIYSIPTDSTIVFDYSMKMNLDGRPTNPNDVYNKIIGINFLSPYALWSIQFTNERNATSLTKFENEKIDIEFVGKGQYLKNVPDVTYETCTNDLDNYYYLDSIRNFTLV